MKKFVVALVVMTMVVLFSVNAFAEHFVSGFEGIKCASVPPMPGIYIKQFLYHYSSDKMMDADGDELPVDFNIDVNVSVTKLLYISEDIKLFGSNYGAQLLVPVVNTDIKMNSPFGSFDDNSTEVGDINVAPIVLSWQKPRYDLSFGTSLYIPVGATGEPASAGKGYYTWMITAGGTLYLDDAKTWAFRRGYVTPLPCRAIRSDAWRDIA